MKIKWLDNTIWQLGSRRRRVMVVVVAMVLGTWIYLRDASEFNSREFRAERKVVGCSLFERGVLGSSDRMVVKTKASGVIQEMVETGTHVKKDDFLLRIDTVHPEEEGDKADMEIRKRQIEKAVLERKHAKVRHEEQCKIAMNKTRLEHAKLELRVESKAMTDEDRRLLEIERGLGDLDAEDAREDFTYQKHLFDRKFISASMLDKFERALKAAVAYQEELKVKTRLKEKGIPVERRLELERNVTREQANVERGQKAMERRMMEVEHEIKVVESKIAQQQFEWNWWKQMIRNSMLRAPRDGVVRRLEHIDWRSGGKWTEKAPGYRTWGWDSDIEIINTNRMQVELMVNEADFNRLRKDVKVRVRLPACPGREFSGRLASLGGIGRDRFEVAQRGQEERPTGVTMFNAAVCIDCKDVTFHPGMSAMVEFVLEPPAERLVVPRQAVYRKGTQSVVYRKSRMGRPVATTVAGRIINDEYFLVTQGLEVGDVVVQNDEHKGS